jgi:hypothetical protein
MKRINMADLEAAVRVLNQTIGAKEGKYAGSYFLQGAYGGWQLQQFVSTHSDSVLATVAITSGFRTKREVYDLIHAITYGIRTGMSSPLKI